jgi:putative endonuclease
MSRALGNTAEQRAAQFLAARGMRIVATNYTCRTGELDLICREGDTLVFVEVRSRSDAAFGDPLETITREKCRRIISAARVYLHESRWRRACRFDVVTLVGDRITLISDAFSTTAY